MNFVTLALAFSGASALVVRQPRIPSDSYGLSRRQASALDPDEIPDQCTTQCQPLVDATQNCADGDNACICTAAVSSDFQSCLNCLSGVIGTDPSFGPAVQAAANVFNSGCSQAGISVPSLTIAAPGTAPSGAPAPASQSGAPASGPSVTPLPGGTLSIPSGSTTIATGAAGTTIPAASTGSPAVPSNAVPVPAGNSSGSIPNASSAPSAGTTGAPVNPPATKSGARRLQAGIPTAIVVIAATISFYI